MRFSIRKTMMWSNRTNVFLLIACFALGVYAGFTLLALGYYFSFSSSPSPSLSFPLTSDPSKSRPGLLETDDVPRNHASRKKERTRKFLPTTERRFGHGKNSAAHRHERRPEGFIIFSYEDDSLLLLSSSSGIESLSSANSSLYRSLESLLPTGLIRNSKFFLFRKYAGGKKHTENVNKNGQKPNNKLEIFKGRIPIVHFADDNLDKKSPCLNNTSASPTGRGQGEAEEENEQQQQRQQCLMLHHSLDTLSSGGFSSRNSVLDRHLRLFLPQSVIQDPRMLHTVLLSAKTAVRMSGLAADRPDFSFVFLRISSSEKRKDNNTIPDTQGNRTTTEQIDDLPVPLVTPENLIGYGGSLFSLNYILVRLKMAMVARNENQEFSNSTLPNLLNLVHAKAMVIQHGDVLVLFRTIGQTGMSELSMEQINVELDHFLLSISNDKRSGDIL